MRHTAASPAAHTRPELRLFLPLSLSELRLAVRHTAGRGSQPPPLTGREPGPGYPPWAGRDAGAGQMIVVIASQPLHCVPAITLLPSHCVVAIAS